MIKHSRLAMTHFKVRQTPLQKRDKTHQKIAIRPREDLSHLVFFFLSGFVHSFLCAACLLALLASTPLNLVCAPAFFSCLLSYAHAHVCTNAHACSEPRIWRRNVKQGCCGPFEQNSGGCAAGWLQLKRHLVWKRLGNNSLWLDNKPRQCLLRH